MQTSDTDQTYANAARLRMPFDQYGRYRMVQEAVQAACRALGQQRLRILDVGGYYQEADGSPRLPSQQFLSDHDLTVLDIVPCDLPGYVQGDGTNLTFADADFDLVISCDTLEHIPLDLRNRFVDELVRTARYGVFLICPFGTDEVVLAERILAAYIQAELHADHDQLREHRTYGLPQMELVGPAFDQAGCVWHEYPAGDLHAWLPMMLAKHYLLRYTDSEPELQYGLDKLYNQSYALAERRDPAYRRLIVAAKQNTGDWLAAVAALLEPTVTRVAKADPAFWPGRATQVLELLQLGLATRQEEWRVQHLQQYIESQREHIGSLDKIFAEHHKIIDAQQEHIGSLDKVFAEHHKIIDAQQEHVGNLDKVFAEHHKIIDAQRQHVSHLDRIIADQQMFIQRLQLHIEALNVTLNQQMEHIADLEARSRWLSEQSSAAQAQLAAVERGLVMRLLRRFSR